MGTPKFISASKCVFMECMRTLCSQRGSAATKTKHLTTEARRHGGKPKATAKKSKVKTSTQRNFGGRGELKKSLNAKISNKFFAA
jgi:hypothetical protein